MLLRGDGKRGGRWLRLRRARFHFLSQVVAAQVSLLLLNFKYAFSTHLHLHLTARCFKLRFCVAGGGCGEVDLLEGVSHPSWWESLKCQYPRAALPQKALIPCLGARGWQPAREKQGRGLSLPQLSVQDFISPPFQSRLGSTLRRAGRPQIRNLTSSASPENDLGTSTGPCGGRQSPGQAGWRKGPGSQTTGNPGCRQRACFQPHLSPPPHTMVTPQSCEHFWGSAGPAPAP